MGSMMTLPFNGQILQPGDDAPENATWLVEVDMYTGDDADSQASVPPFLVANTALGDFPAGSAAAERTRTLTISDRGWVGAADDEWRPNVDYSGRLASPVKWSTSRPVYIGDSRRSSFSVGILNIHAADRALETAYTNYEVLRRAVSIYRGPATTPPAPFSEFKRVFTAKAVNWSGNPETINIALRDDGYRFDSKFQSNLYDGLGGAGGSAEWKNKPIPWLGGYKANIRPDFIDATYLVYRFHDSQAVSVCEVRDRGGVLSPTSDYPDYASLIAATLATDEYATCLALGLVRTGALSPFLTIDAEGVDISDPDNAPYHRVAYLIAAIWRKAGIGDGEISPILYDLYRFPGDGLNFKCGLYETSGGSCSSVIDAFMQSVNSYWERGLDGNYIAGWVAQEIYDALPQNYQYEVTETELIDVPRESDPQGAPLSRISVAYGVLATTQSGTDLLDTISSSDRIYYESGYYTSEYSDDIDLEKYPFAEDADIILSPFAAEDEGESCALSMAAVMGGVYQLRIREFDIPLGRSGHGIPDGAWLKVTYPALIFADGPVGWVRGREVDGDNVTLSVVFLRR